MILGKKNRKQGRSRPRFKPELWNIYERTLNGLLTLRSLINSTVLGEQRTNNTLEGYHNGINQHHDCAHPNIWLFLLKLKTFQVKVDVTVRELHEKGPTVKRRATIYDHQQNLCERYEEFSPTDFINEIAKLL
ncbi:MAG: hypothetical protein DI539_31645 [Flavobacterium psychrophilum]|nr:MAG: hypothetical protein DI539_31645 [Flavobacterium psychrophilum]